MQCDWRRTAGGMPVNPTIAGHRHQIPTAYGIIGNSQIVVMTCADQRGSRFNRSCLSLCSRKLSLEVQTSIAITCRWDRGFPHSTPLSASAD
jgi:hypothetical protein